MSPPGAGWLNCFGSDSNGSMLTHPGRISTHPLVRDPYEAAVTQVRPALKRWHVGPNQRDGMAGGSARVDNLFGWALSPCCCCCCCCCFLLLPAPASCFLPLLPLLLLLFIKMREEQQTAPPPPPPLPPRPTFPAHRASPGHHPLAARPPSSIAPPPHAPIRPASTACSHSPCPHLSLSFALPQPLAPIRPTGQTVWDQVRERGPVRHSRHLHGVHPLPTIS